MPARNSRRGADVTMLRAPFVQLLVAFVSGGSRACKQRTFAPP